jgi:hypothetical protein
MHDWRVGDLALLVSPITGKVDAMGEIISFDDPAIRTHDGMDTAWYEYGNPPPNGKGFWSIKKAWLRPLPPFDEGACSEREKELVDA